MTSQEPVERRALDPVIYNAESVQPRLDGYAEEIFSPDLSNVELRRQDGKNVRWLVSKGHARFDGRDVHLVERLPEGRGRKRADDLDYALSAPTLVIDRNMRSVLAFLHGGIVTNNDEVFSVFSSKDEVYKQTERLLIDIRTSSRQIAAQEQQARKVQSRRRAGRIGRAVTTLAVVGGILWQGPHIVNEADEWRQREAAQATEERARKAVAKEAENRAAAERVAAFDREHPELRTKSQLRDGIKVPVPFTEEFDGQTVPRPVSPDDAANIRRYPLPGSDKCIEIILIIPEGQILEAARTGDPREIIFAEQDSLSNKVKVCDADLDSTDSVSSGELFLKLARR